VGLGTMFPHAPLLSRSDLPKSFPHASRGSSPGKELDRLMKAIGELQDPLPAGGAAAGALERSSPRRDQPAHRRLPGRLPRRLPAAADPGRQRPTPKRMIPLHPQAADALRDLIGHARTVGAAARYDTWAHQSVRWVFMHRGQPLGKHYLFDEPLEIACRQAGLIDAGGAPHRIRTPLPAHRRHPARRGRRADPDHHGDPRTPQRDDVCDVLPHQRSGAQGALREGNRGRRPGGRASCRDFADETSWGKTPWTG